MYGGHITDDWDRKLCKNYLLEYIHPDQVGILSGWPPVMPALQLDGELYYAPGFPCPPNLDYKGYEQYITEMLPPETPYLYGMHLNAEIGYATTTSASLFKTVFELQPRDAGAGMGTVTTKEEKVVVSAWSQSNAKVFQIKQILDEINDKLPEEFNMLELLGKTEDRSPYTVVFWSL